MPQFVNLLDELNDNSFIIVVVVVVMVLDDDDRFLRFYLYRDHLDIIIRGRVSPFP